MILIFFPFFVISLMYSLTLSVSTPSLTPKRFSFLCFSHFPLITGIFGTTIIEFLSALISECVAPSPVSVLQRIVLVSIFGYISVRC